MFGDVDRSCHNLLELPTQEKYGFLIVHPQVDGEVDIDALLGADLAEELANWEFEKTQFEGETSVARDLNWKLANDTFGENYHFSTLHSDTLSHLAHSDYATYDEYGRNHRICTANRYLDVMKTQPESDWNFAFASIAAYYIFPNVQLVFVGGMVFMVRIYPDPNKVDRSVSRITHYSMPHVREQVADGHEATEVTAENVYQADTSVRMEFDASATAELLISTVEHEDYLMSEKPRSPRMGASSTTSCLGETNPRFIIFTTITWKRWANRRLRNIEQDRTHHEQYRCRRIGKDVGKWNAPVVDCRPPERISNSLRSSSHA